MILWVCMLGGGILADKKDCRIAMRLSENLYKEIDRTVELFRDKTKVEVSRTTIVTSAITEGLKVLQKQINDEK